MTSIICFFLAFLSAITSLGYTEGVLYKRIISSILTGISAGLLILSINSYVKENRYNEMVDKESNVLLELKKENQ